jgi:hypothetical protein
VLAEKRSLIDIRGAVEGIDRFKEALQCHMWPNLERLNVNNAAFQSEEPKHVSSKEDHSTSEDAVPDKDFAQWDELFQTVQTVKQQGCSLCNFPP